MHRVSAAPMPDDGAAVGQWLRPGGYAIMTIKLSSTRPSKGIAAAHALSADVYDVVATRHFPHNRQEVTMLLRRRAGEKLC